MRSRRMQIKEQFEDTVSGGAPYPIVRERRLFKFVQLRDSAVGFEIMVYGQERSWDRTLVIVHTIYHPVPPPQHVCEIMANAGWRIVFVRRPGFGRSSPLPQKLYDTDLIRTSATVSAEASVLARLIHELDIEEATLLGIATAAPVAARLAFLSKRVSRLALINPSLRTPQWHSNTPKWVRTVIDQVFQSRAGVYLAERGFKHLLRRDIDSFYKQFANGGGADNTFYEQNRIDHLHAREVLLKVSSDIIFAEVHINACNDSFFTDGLFEHLETKFFIGADCTEYWRSELEHEAARTGARLHIAPQGDLSNGMSCPQFLVDNLA